MAEKISLKQIRNQREKVESIKERIARLRSAMLMGNKQLTEMPGSKEVRDRLANDMVKLIELEHELFGEVISMEHNITRAKALIETLPEQQQRILRFRYIDGLSWRKVAQKANYSQDHCFALHRAALNNLSKSYTNKTS
jgi:DNA-directed RNA polymerase specialized sigma subunit